MPICKFWFLIISFYKYFVLSPKFANLLVFDFPLKKYIKYHRYHLTVACNTDLPFIDYYDCFFLIFEGST